MLGQTLWLVAALISPLTVSGVEPNFEDLDLVVDQARDEKVDVTQENPHSNNIHVAHNNPKNRSAVSSLFTIRSRHKETDLQPNVNRQNISIIREYRGLS